MTEYTDAQVRDTVSAWLGELGWAFGVTLKLDDRGAAGLVLSDGTRVIVEVEPSVAAVHIHAEVMRLLNDKETRERVLEAAMVLNVYARRTQGATLGLDLRTDAVVLSITRAVAELDAAGFASLLGAFVETLGTLREELNAPAVMHPARVARASTLHPAVGSNLQRKFSGWR